MKKSNQPALIFLHIPKTAGTTLTTVLARQYPQDKTLSIFDEPLDAPSLQQLPEHQREKLQYVRGHVRFGLHEFLPQPSTYITFLRDPIDRIISTYYFTFRTPSHPLYELFLSQKIGLGDFVSSGIRVMTENGQVRLLAGKAGVETPFGQCNAELLDIAKHNIQDKFSLVGLSGRFDESLILLKRQFGWRNVAYISRNVTANRPQKADVSEQDLALIQEYNQLDLELYRYIQEQFQQQIDEQGADFAQELSRFKAANKRAAVVQGAIVATRDTILSPLRQIKRGLYR